MASRSGGRKQMPAPQHGRVETAHSKCTCTMVEGGDPAISRHAAISNRWVFSTELVFMDSFNKCIRELLRATLPRQGKFDASQAAIPQISCAPEDGPVKDIFVSSRCAVTVTYPDQLAFPTAIHTAAALRVSMETATIRSIGLRRSHG